MTEASINRKKKSFGIFVGQKISDLTKKIFAHQLFLLQKNCHYNKAFKQIKEKKI